MDKRWYLDVNQYAKTTPWAHGFMTAYYDASWLPGGRGDPVLGPAGGHRLVDRPPAPRARGGRHLDRSGRAGRLWGSARPWPRLWPGLGPTRS